MTKIKLDAALFSDGDTIVTAVSGGADSVCLLHMLCQLRRARRLTLYACHVNHGLRGADAMRDQEFTERLCREWDVPCFVKTADVAGYAEERRLTVEEAGRQLRYAFFEETAQMVHADRIATAHHKNDQAETILMHLIRGCATRGMGGIPKQRGKIIRPLLDVSREEIEEYCSEHRLSYVTDSTNFETEYTRNRIRHTLLPSLIQMNERIVDTLSRNSVLFREDDDCLEAQARALYQKAIRSQALDVSVLKNQHVSLVRRILRMMLEEQGLPISYDYIERITVMIYEDTKGPLILPGGFSAEKRYGMLYFEKKEIRTVSFARPLVRGCVTAIPELGISVEVIPAFTAGKNTFTLPENGVCEIRNRKPGDRFYPVGMTGSKKVKDFLIDRKIPKEERSRIPIITCNGEIVCLLGLRDDRRFAFSGEGVQILVNKL